MESRLENVDKDISQNKLEVNNFSDVISKLDDKVTAKNTENKQKKKEIKILQSEIKEKIKIIVDLQDNIGKISDYTDSIQKLKENLEFEIERHRTEKVSHELYRVLNERSLGIFKRTSPRNNKIKSKSIIRIDQR